MFDRLDMYMCYLSFVEGQTNIEEFMFAHNWLLDMIAVDQFSCGPERSLADALNVVYRNYLEPGMRNYQLDSDIRVIVPN